MTAPRIATFDVETAPVLGYVWGLWKQNLGLEMIRQDWHMLSFAWKWLGDPRIVYKDQSKASTLEDDSELLKSVWTLLDQADIVIAHNGVSFDVKKLNARFITLDFPPPSPYRVIDTLKETRKVAAFTSNRLAWLSEQLTDTPKSTHDQFPGFLLWQQVLMGNPKAWGEMRKYNIRDVIALEKVYLKLRPWMLHHPSVAAYGAMEGCTRCGSLDLVRQGYRTTQAGRYPRFQCRACGGWSHGRIMQKEERTELLTN